ncbi:hypothetical protein [Bosea sp. (in: a-proteobacteria)]|uniref:hypothetical protein n=1 Tax=Bosea sp. (in: a-proteobacteria) TaxID=1871050 RepID=UPI003B3B6507
MGAAAAPAMAVMSIAGKGMEIAGGISQGIQNKVAAQIDTVKLKMAAEAGKVRAIQTDAAYRDDLNNTLQNIGAIRAGQNVGFDSPTSFAIYDKARSLSDNARITAVSNERLKALGLEGDAAAAWKRGETARTTATLGQAKNILSLGQEVAGFMK